MQNNVIELTQRLLRSLDSNYNVIDMPTVVEIISLLEKVVITKELLETTRLGKYINELRRKTTNEALSKRAKELVKKWRNAFLLESNGQIKQSPPPQQQQQQQQEDVNLNQLKAKKRPAKEPPDNPVVKRTKLNGGISELDFSDNSNSSFKDVIAAAVKTEPKRDVILINSDSNSSMPEKHDPHLDQQMPKKRGRKKGSKNHKNLVDEAESSFTSKLAVSRGNSKVKTTQELIASLQNRNSGATAINSLKPKEDLMEKAAKLTERVSIIDQKLNTNAGRNKNSQRNKYKVEKVIESGIVINDKSLLSPKKEEEDINVVDADEEEEEEEVKQEPKAENQETEPGTDSVVRSLTVEEILAQLPPVDRSVLLEDDEPRCTCASLDEEDPDCPAKFDQTRRYRLDHNKEEHARRLHAAYLPNVNGNYGTGPPKPGPRTTEDGLYADVVPDVNAERIPKDVRWFSGESYSRYSFSEASPDHVKSEVVERTGDDGGGEDAFREWHELVETPSYGGETFRILPYVIID